MIKHFSTNQIISKPALFLAAISAILVLGGCQQVQPPVFSAVGVREIEHTQERSVIEFSVQATNPNKEPIPLKQIHYRVEIDGVEVFVGIRTPQITLHTFSSHVFDLPAVIPSDALSGSKSVTYQLTGTAQYIPPGRLAEVLFDAEMKVPEAVLDLSGTINLGETQDTAAVDGE